MGWVVAYSLAWEPPTFSCFSSELTWCPEAVVDLCLVPFQVWEQRARRRCTVKSGKLTPVSEGPLAPPARGWGEGTSRKLIHGVLGVGRGKKEPRRPERVPELLTLSSPPPLKSGHR